MRSNRTKRRGKNTPLWIGLGGLGGITVIVLAAFLALRGGSAKDVAAVKAVAQAFLEASKNNDAKAFRAVLTEKARKNLQSGAFEQQELSGSIGDITVKRNTAEVSIIVPAGEGQDLEAILKLRRESGEWRVYAFAAPLPQLLGGRRITIDFENPQATQKEMVQAFNEMAERSMRILTGKEKGETPKPTPLKSVSLDQYHAAWRVDVDVKDQPAGALLTKLTRELGLRLQTAAAQKPALAKPVTVNLKKTSRLKAIEEVCRQIGLFPEYTRRSKQATLRLKEGPRPWPVTFAGPFLVEVTDVKDNAPYPTGQLDLRFYAPGLPPVVRRVLRDSFSPITFQEIADSQGRDLTDLTRGGGGLVGFSPIYEYESYSALKNLLRSVTAIKSVRGRIQFRLPTKIEKVRFDKITGGMSRKAGNIELTIVRAKLASNSSSLDFEVKDLSAGIPSNKVMLEFVDAQGRKVDTISREERRTFSHRNRRLRDGRWILLIKVMLLGQPAAINATVVEQDEEFDYEFQLADIPLKFYSNMPVKIEPARFAGHGIPVTLEFVKIVPDPNFPNFRQNVRLRVINHADKKIQRLNMAFEYLDASGKTLKDWSMASYSGMLTFPSKEPVIVVAENRRTEFDTDAPFMPKETKTVAITLKKVRFVDAEEWTPKADEKP